MTGWGWRMEEVGVVEGREKGEQRATKGETGPLSVTGMGLGFSDCFGVNG